MPIYGQRDDRDWLVNSKLAGLDIARAPSGILESLPSFNNVMDAGLGELGQSVFMEQWSAKKASNAAIGTQYQAASVMSTVGAPLGSTAYRGLMEVIAFEDPGGAIRSIISSYAGRISGKVFDALVDELMEVVSDALKEIMGSAFEAIGSIPVVGWILDAALEIANLIINIIKLAQLKKSAGKVEQEIDPANFQPNIDRDLAKSRIIGAMKNSVDWTNIFMPPNLYDNHPQEWKSMKLSHNRGRRIYVLGDHGENWLGFIPGSSAVDRGAFEVNPKATQSIPFMRNLGMLLPTSRDMGSVCWSQIMGSDGWKKPSPAMFTVNADRAIRAWQEYLFWFRLRLESGQGLNLDKETRKAIVNKLAGENGMYGWASWGAKYDEQKEFDNFGINQSAPIAALRAIKKRQYETLNRIDVAYVGPHYGAIQSYHSKMRNRWEKNRELLLSHDSRCKVDVSNIPDVSYRMAMESANEPDPLRGKLGCVPSHRGTLTAYPESRNLPGAGAMPPASPPRYQTSVKLVRGLVDTETKKRRRSKGKSGSLVLIGLGVAFLAVASKKK